MRRRGAVGTRTRGRAHRASAGIGRLTLPPRTVAVPRLLGLTRVLRVPPLRGAVDLFTGPTAGPLSAAARKLAVERTPGAQRSGSETLRG